MVTKTWKEMDTSNKNARIGHQTANFLLGCPQMRVNEAGNSLRTGEGQTGADLAFTTKQKTHRRTGPITPAPNGPNMIGNA